MLKPCPSQTCLIVCSTCRHSRASSDDVRGVRGGAAFGALLVATLARHALRDRLDIQSMDCLFACKNHCTAHLRSVGRLGYIFGDFQPTPFHADALLDFIEKYLRTADGVVPYEHWPEGIKGHFLVRVPPAGFLWSEPSAP